MSVCLLKLEVTGNFCDQLGTIRIRKRAHPISSPEVVKQWKRCVLKSLIYHKCVGISACPNEPFTKTRALSTRTTLLSSRRVSGQPTFATR